MMKGRVVVAILLILVIEAAAILAMYYYFSNNNSCDYNDSSKIYLIKKQPCVINFLCTVNHTTFADSCGCGCELNS